MKQCPSCKENTIRYRDILFKISVRKCPVCNSSWVLPWYANLIYFIPPLNVAVFKCFSVVSMLDIIISTSFLVFFFCPLILLKIVPLRKDE